MGGRDGTTTPSEGASVARYTAVSSLAEGGGGAVRRVRDGHLGRQVAMKVQHWGSAEARFEREARILARLQHPTIVALYDAGSLPDGRAWFTMPEVRGRTLGELVQAVHAVSDGSWGTTADGWNLPRLVGVLEEVAQAVAYAHGEGVVHRDLHPGNVMVGSFGEVYLVDWGIALEVGEEDLVLDGVEEEGADLGEDDDEEVRGTRHGTRLGTPAYMAPEQARGEVLHHGPHTDAYALGALLDTVLTGEPPYRGGARAWRAVLRGPPLPRAERLRPRAPAPPDDLAHLADRALSRAIDDRPTAALFARALREWLDGTAARARALSRVSRADALLDALRQTEARIAELRAAASAILTGLPPGAGLEARRRGWVLDAEASALGLDAARLEADALGELHAALGDVPDLDEAHRRLADHYRRHAEAAEARADARGLAHNEQLLRLHDRGVHAGWLAGEGTLILDSDPPGVEVVGRPYTLVDLRRLPGTPRPLGRTPLDVRLPHGPWELTLTRPDGVSVVLPVVVPRQGVWRHRPPGADHDLPVRVLEVSEDACLVPAGWFVAGGDADAIDALPRRRLWADDVVFARDPVTVRQYLDFLDAVRAADGPNAVAPLLPSWRPSPTAAPVHLAVWEDGRGHRIEVLDGMAPWSDDQPIVLIDHACATRYAAWRAEQDGLPWRLPHDLEWEKAARGPAGWAYPWGDALDPALCCMKESHAGLPGRVPVGEPPHDVSVYGVRGLGGNVQDWCASGYTRAAPEDGSALDGSPAGDASYRMCRGGGWTGSTNNCRSAGRMAAKPASRFTMLGLRLCRSV